MCFQAAGVVSGVMDSVIFEEAVATMIADASADMADLESTVPLPDVTPIVPHPSVEVPGAVTDDASTASMIVSLSDVSPSITPTPLDLPGVITSEVPSTSGTVSTGQPPRRSGRRKSVKLNLKKRNLEALQEIEYAVAVLSASKFCHFFVIKLT